MVYSYRRCPHLLIIDLSIDGLVYKILVIYLSNVEHTAITRISS